MSSTLVGRESELAALSESMDEALAGRPRLVLCEGEPGIGKTTLVAELVGLASARGVSAAWAQGIDAPGAPPLWPWRQILRSVAVQVDLCALAGEHRLTAELGRLAPDIFAGAEPAEASGTVEERFRQFDAIARMLRALAQRDPLLVVLDDVHWADDASVLLLQHVARTMRDERLLVVTTMRDTGRAPAVTFGQVPVAHRIRLRGLPRQAVSRQLSAVLGRGVDDAESARIHDLTGGNPFFVAEVARASAAGQPGIPASVRDAIGARLARLSPECVEVLEAASIVGREFAVAVVAKVVGRAPVKCLAALDEAVDAGLAATDDNGDYRFAHAVLRDAVEAGLSSGERVRLHRRVASAIEECHHGDLNAWLFDLARHWSVAAVAGERECAARWLRRAADEAMRQLAFEDAAELFGRTLGLGSLDATQRCQVLAALGTARQASGDASGAMDACREAARIADELGRPDLVAEAALALEPAFLPEVTTALRQLCETALATLGADRVALRARVAARFAEACHFLGDVAPARPVSEGLIEAAERIGDPEALSAALQARQLVCSGPDGLAERTRIADRMVTLGRESKNPRAQLWGHLWRVDTAFEQGDLVTVAKELTDIGWCAERVGGPLARWQLARVRTMLAQAQARFADAQQYLAAGFAAVAPIEDVEASLARGALTSAAEHHTGHTADSLAAMGLSEPVAAQPDVLTGGVVEALATAWLLNEVGRFDDAASIYRLLGPAEQWQPMPHCALLGYAFGVQVAAAFPPGSQQADLAALRQRLDPYRGHHVVSGAACLGYLGPVELWLGVAAAHTRDFDQAVADLDRAVAITGRCGTPGFGVEARYELASALANRAAAGDRTRARELATEAAAQAASLGMTPIAVKVSRLLDRLDPAPSALTPREREVAELVAGGLTNREIAARLFLSERTAQTHVQHILTKLDLANRSQIAAWAASRNLSTPAR